MSTYKIHTLQFHQWGYELPVAITLDDDSIHEELIRFQKMPDKAEIEKAVHERIIRLESLSVEEPDEMISKREVERILVEKGYLIKGKSFEDLAAKEVIKEAR